MTVPLTFELLQVFFVEQCQKRFSTSSINFRTALYSLAGQCIVQESLPYVERLEEEKILVQCFRDRQDCRNENPHLAADKSNNSIIVVAGGPGCGKSTLEVRLPVSVTYNEYVQSCHEEGVCVPPIVSAFTFNGGMGVEVTDTSPYTGLRILYGALTSMCLAAAPSQELSWDVFLKEFCVQFGKTAIVSVMEAVETLRLVYGEDRRVLLLVDELSKASNHHADRDTDVLRELGTLLDKYGWVDVVVSSLSVDYITDLATGSQRRVEYVALPVLLDTSLGAEAAHSWTHAVLAKAGLDENTAHSFVVNLLRNVCMLASGHPRSLERLVKVLELKQGEVHPCWNEVVSAVARKNSVVPLLGKLSRVVQEKCAYLLEISEHCDQVLAMVLSCSAVDLLNALVRQLVEKGGIYLVPYYSSSYLLAAVRFDNFLKLARHAATRCAGVVPSDYSRALSVLFGDIAMQMNTERIGVLWERAVALTIVCRSLGSDKDLVLGDDRRLFDCSAALSVVIASDSQCLDDAHDNELVMSPVHFPGLDGRLITCDHAAYLQMKIAPSDKTNVVEMVAKTVVLCLLDHLRRPCTRDIPLDKVRIVLYVWGSLPCPLSKEEVLKEVGMFMETILTGEQLLQLQHSVYEFVSEHFSHIVLLGKDELDLWLIPSLRPIPRMVEAIDIDA